MDDWCPCLLGESLRFALQVIILLRVSGVKVEITHKSVFALFCLSGVAFFPNIWCSTAYVDPLNVGCSEIWVISSVKVLTFAVMCCRIKAKCLILP